MPLLLTHKFLEERIIESEVATQRDPFSDYPPKQEGGTYIHISFTTFFMMVKNKQPECAIMVKLK